MVVHIAKELAANVKNEEGVMALLPTVLTVWDTDETAAYRWWKEGNAQRARLRMGGAGASVKSEVTSQPSIKADVLRLGVLPESGADLGREKTQSQQTQAAAALPTHQNLSADKMVGSAPVAPAPAQAPAQVTPRPALDLDAIENRILNLMQHHNSVQEATTKAINHEKIKRCAEVDLATTTAQLERARQIGSLDEVEQLEKEVKQAGEEAVCAVNAYRQAVAEMAEKQREFWEEQDKLGAEIGRED
ncbi:hypothetical protein LRP88_02263 [Fusarium phalaenopsidis]